MVPSVADITQAKASQIFDQVMEVISNNDLSSLQKKVEDKIEEENITAMELCAGFLKLHLGDDMEEIPAENYIEEMRKKRAERKGGRSGRKSLIKNRIRNLKKREVTEKDQTSLRRNQRACLERSALSKRTILIRRQERQRNGSKTKSTW